VRFAVIPAYVALFFAIGVALPYWPAWLESQSLDATTIGVLLGIGPWVRLSLNPTVGRFADRHGVAHRLVVVGGAIMLAAYLSLLLGGHGLASIALWVFVGAIGFGPLVPLTDSVALRHDSIDYPRVRAWGSAAFICASFLGGWLLDGRGPDAVLVALCACALGIVVTGLLLPGPPAQARETTRTRSQRDSDEKLASPWRVPGFGLFVATAALLNGSHAVLYGFGTLHWRAAGVSETVIGMLWSIGVIAEILLFTAGGRLIERLGATGLFLVAGGGGVLRWIVLASSSAFPALLGAQLLHAATFACMHLGAMIFIRERVPEAATSRATALYSAVATGLAMGLCMPLAGLLYARFAGGAFWAMASSSAAAVLGAMLLRARIGPRPTSQRKSATDADVDPRATEVVGVPR